MKPKLGKADFIVAASKLMVDVPAIKAVAEVESGGDGFLSNGDIKILFEGHQFYKYTKGVYARSHPTICYPKWTSAFYCKGKTDARGACELERLRQAQALDHKAALYSASYGKFQIMGFNYTLCGFTGVDEFVDFMKESEGNQLQAFCEYITNTNLDDPLRAHSWADFARRYNGPGYAKNAYDKKLAAAYTKHKLHPDL